MLIALLFQLGIEQRARELGTLAAVGVGRRRIARLLAREGLIVAAIGATIGVAAGIVYAWLMISGLRTWWLAAISTPFLELHVAWPSLADRLARRRCRFLADDPLVDPPTGAAAGRTRLLAWLDRRGAATAADAARSAAGSSWPMLRDRACCC